MYGVPVSIGINVLSSLVSSALLYGIGKVRGNPTSNPTTQIPKKKLLANLALTEPYAIEIIPDGRDYKSFYNDVFKLIGEDLKFIRSVDVHYILKTKGKPRFIQIVDYPHLFDYINAMPPEVKAKATSHPSILAMFGEDGSKGYNWFLEYFPNETIIIVTSDAKTGNTQFMNYISKKMGGDVVKVRPDIAITELSDEELLERDLGGVLNG